MVEVLLDKGARMDYVGGQLYKRQDHGKVSQVKKCGLTQNIR